MLPKDVRGVVERRIAQDLEDRRDLFDREIAQLWEQMTSTGGLHSGATLTETVQAVGNELRIRASLIWEALARALDAKRIALDDFTASKAKGYISELLHTHTADLSEHLQKVQYLVKGGHALKSLSDLCAAALDRIYTEIDYATLRHSSPSTPTTSVTTIYQSFGIVQTGPASSATVSLSFVTESRPVIERAIEAVRPVIEQAVTLDPDERSQALELLTPA